MQAALKAVEQGKSVNKASQNFNVGIHSNPASSSASSSRSGVSSASCDGTFSLSSSGGKNSALSKLLVVPSVSTPAGPKKAQPRAHLLTSAAALEIWEEKEQRKKKELELKEQKKWEGEENKRKREKKQKRKVEERARKAEEKAKEKMQKVAERACKTKERAHKARGKGKAKAESDAPTCTRSSTHPPSKKARLENEDIDDSKCCVCFTTYEDDVVNRSGKDWVCCACGRWLHEECVEECVLDSTGKERLCPLCLDLFAI